MDVRFDGKVALVTGSSRGIGLAIATELAASGARVMLSSRKADALEAAVAGIDGDVAWTVANAGEPDQAAACVAATIERFGAVDILVNNAATNPYMGPTIDIDLPRLDKTIAVNWRAPLVWSQLAWQRSMQEHGGAILNVASIGGLSVEPTIGAYNATKAALLHLTRTLAAELAPGVRVNAIAPGPGEDRHGPRAVGAPRGRRWPARCRSAGSASPTTSPRPRRSCAPTPRRGSPARRSSSTAAPSSTADPPVLASYRCPYGTSATPKR